MEKELPINLFTVSKNDFKYFSVTKEFSRNRIITILFNDWSIIRC